MKMTSGEKAFLKFIKDHHLPISYTGDGKLWIGNRNPDFTHKTEQIVYEVFGKAFHTPDYGMFKHRPIPHRCTVDGTLNHYHEQGYQCIIIWDYELVKRQKGRYNYLELPNRIKSKLGII